MDHENRGQKESENEILKFRDCKIKVISENLEDYTSMEDFVNKSGIISKDGSLFMDRARDQKSKITYGMFSSVVVTVGDFLGLDVTTRSES